MNHNRVGWVDQFRGMAILLVVYGHVGRGLDNAGLWDFKGSFLDDFIYSFHMPAFFFAAGLFARRSLYKGRGHFLLDKLRTIAYPYLLWSIIYILSLMALPGGNSHYEASLWERIAYEPVGNYWFLYVLFMLEIVFMIVRPMPFGPLIFYTLALAAWVGESAGLFEGLFKHDPYWAWHNIAKYGVYFAFGDAVVTMGDRHANEPRNTGLFALLFFGSLSLLLSFGHHPEQSWWDLPLALAGIQGLWELAVLCEQRGIRWLAFLGRHSLAIYVAHFLATAATRMMLVKLGIGTDVISVHFFLGTVAGVLFPLGLWWLTNQAGFHYLFTFGEKTHRQSHDRTG